mgnify:CR=1 FL=1|jgi:hypothetical protein
MVDKKKDIVTSTMISQFASVDEPILFEANITKLSRYGFS